MPHTETICPICGGDCPGNGCDYALKEALAAVAVTPQSVDYLTAAPPDADLPGTEQQAVFPACFRNEGGRHRIRRVRIPTAGLAVQLEWYGRALFGYVPAKRWALWELDPSGRRVLVRIMEAEEVYPLPRERGEAFAPYDLDPGQYCHVRRDPAREIRDGGFYVCTLWPV